MKLDREALWWKYSNAGVMISIRGFHALLDAIERQRGEPALAKAIELLWSANSWLLYPGAPYQHQRLELAKAIQQFLVAAPSATGQVSPSVAPADSESGSAVGPARSAEPQERETEECPTCHGRGQICVGTSGLESDGNAPEFERCPECGYSGPDQWEAGDIAIENTELRLLLSQAREQIAKQEEEIKTWQRQFSALAAQRKD